MWLTQRGEEKGKLWGKRYSPPCCPLISQEEKHIKFAVLISIVFKKSNLCNEYLPGGSPAGCWQPGFLDTVWNGGCTFHLLPLSPFLRLFFITIYLTSGQRCSCCHCEGPCTSVVLTVLSPHPAGLSLVAGALPGPSRAELPPKWRKGPLPPPCRSLAAGDAHAGGLSRWGHESGSFLSKAQIKIQRWSNLVYFHGRQWPSCSRSWDSCPSQNGTR